MFSSVLFDLDETLLDRSKSLRRYLQWESSIFLKLNEADQKKYTYRFIELDDNGAQCKGQVYERLIVEFSICELTAAELLDNYLDSFNKFCCAKPNAVAAVKKLHALNYKLGLVSNGQSPFQERNFESLEIADLFSTVIVSDAIKLRKPDVEIFKLACQRLGAMPRHCIFVGDNPEADIAGANASGMYSVFMPSKRYPVCAEADSTCIDLENLVEIVLSASR